MQGYVKVVGLLLAFIVAAPAVAGGINLSGPHYNLNIIGVTNPKTQPLTGGDRHTIFVALNKSGSVTSKIYLTPGPFAVCDGNAFDPAYACDGTQIAAQGAVFQLPCDTATTATTGTETLIPCTAGVDSAAYQIWARALGTPGGSVTITTCATDDTGAVVCSTDNALLVRNKGKPSFTNVTNQLTSLNACFDVSGVMTCEDVSLFDPSLIDYFWQYDNTGLQHAQLRFYLD